MKRRHHRWVTMTARCEQGVDAVMEDEAMIGEDKDDTNGGDENDGVAVAT